MRLWPEPTVRVRFLGSWSDSVLEVYGNPGDVVDLPAPIAEQRIGAGTAEAAPDAELGAAPQIIEGRPCPHCQMRINEYLVQCPACGRRIQ